MDRSVRKRPNRKHTEPLTQDRGLDAGDVVWTSLLLIVVTSLPYVYGDWSAPEGMWFSGVIFNVHDTAQYFSWMRESATRLFIDNKLTGEPHAPIFLHLHWWIAGRAAHVLGLSLAQIYQICRILAVPLYVLVVYWLADQFFSTRAQRRFAFWLTTLTSGLGWLWVAEKYASGRIDVQHPVDIYTTPGNSFWVLLASPHLAFALSLTLLAIGLSWQSHVQRRPWRAVTAGAVALFLGFGHVYDLVTIWAVLAVFGALLCARHGLAWRRFSLLATVLAISLPAPLYFGWLSSPAHPHWRQTLQQFDNLGVFTPAPLHLFFLFGVTMLLGIGGLVSALKSLCLPGWKRGIEADSSDQAPSVSKARTDRMSADGTDRALFLLGWFAANVVVIYLPLHFQIMLLTGFQFVLSALATDFVFQHVLPRLGASGPQVSRRPWVLGLILLAVVPTNAYLFAWRFVDLQRHDYPYYLRHDDVTALHWLERNTAPDDVILSSFVIGHYVPGFTGARAFLSSAVMTLDFTTKRDLVERFYSSEATDTERCELLGRYDIRWVVDGPAERGVGPYDPSGSPLFSRAFATPDTIVYRTNMEACP